MRIARVLHVMTVACSRCVAACVGGGALYDAGVAVAAVLLVYEHSLVRPDDLSRLDAAFFTMNWHSSASRSSRSCSRSG